MTDADPAPRPRTASPDRAALDAIWREFAGALLDRRPDFRFDAGFYAHRYGDVADRAPDALARHYAETGRDEGRNATLYQETLRDAPDLPGVLATLVRDPRLKAAVAAGEDDALLLTFELMALGDPVDKIVADFSVRHYRKVSPDLAEAPDIGLFLHFVKHGFHEDRPSLASLRRNLVAGERPFDPARRTIVVATHEFSATGAPFVALDIAQRAAESCNVVVMGLRRGGGALIERFAETAVAVIVSAQPFEEWSYFETGPLEFADFAILNSVECFSFAKALVAREIPFVSYVHEFTDYTLPAYKCVVTALYSQKVLFSSETVRRSWDGVLADAAFDVAADSAIVPQATLVPDAVPEADYRAARDRLSALLGCEIGDRRVVYGAGQVQWRKGTDIFAMLAAQGRHTNPDTLFVWIGDGLDHQDFDVGVWVEKHLAAGGVNDPAGNLFHLPAGPYYRDVCRAADVLFLSSRLDPLPNVVFDAVSLGCAVVLFQGASGFDDLRYRDIDTLWRVPFGDLAGVADALEEIPCKTLRDGGFAVRPDGRAAAPAGPAEPVEVVPVFDRIMTAVAGEADGVAAPAAGTAPPRTARTPPSTGRYDVGILYGPADPPELRARERATIWRHGRRAIWPDRAAAEAAIAASDNWVHRTLSIAPYGEILPEDLPSFSTPAFSIPAFSIHVHAFYTEAFAPDLSHYAAYRHAARVVVTTDTEEKADTLMAAGREAGVPVETRLVTNRGRDVLPFLSLFDGEEDPNAIWCHVHLKKSVGLGANSPGEVWRTFLMRILLGGPERLSAAIAAMRLPHVGLVGAFDPYVMGWTGSRRLLAPLQARLDALAAQDGPLAAPGTLDGGPGAGYPLPDHPLLFPVGDMFWIKADVVNRMRSLFGPDHPWPGEPLPGDGTVYHLIERLWPTASALAGRDALFLDKPGERRV